METDQVDLSGLSPEELQRLEDMRARAEHANLAQKEQGQKKDLERAARATAPTPTNGIHYTEIVKERENLFAMVRTQFHEKGIRVVDVDDIKHGDILKVTKHTTSDRTRQLLEAAYCAGKIAGAYLLTEALKEKDKKENT